MSPKFDAGRKESPYRCAGEAIAGLDEAEVGGIAKSGKTTTPAKRQRRPVEYRAWETVNAKEALTDAEFAFGSLRFESKSESDRRKFGELRMLMEAAGRILTNEKKVPADLAKAARDFLGRESRVQRANHLLARAEELRCDFLTAEPAPEKFVREVIRFARSLGFVPLRTWHPFDGRDFHTVTKADIEESARQHFARRPKWADTEADAADAVMGMLREGSAPATERLIEIALKAHEINARGMFDHLRKAKRRKT